MLRSRSVNGIAVVAVGALVALIGGVTLSSSQLITATVEDQFRSQELQLTISLTQQSETTLNALNTDINNLALQPAIKSIASRDRAAALALMAARAAERPGIIVSVALFNQRGDPRYAWPEHLQARIDAGEDLPYAVPRRLVERTINAQMVPLDTELLPSSNAELPDRRSLFLLITPAHNNLRKTDFLVYELDLEALFAQTLGFVDLDQRGQVWVIDSQAQTLLQANDTIPISTIEESISFGALASQREPVVLEYSYEGDERLAFVSLARGINRSFAVILSRSADEAVEKVEADLRRIFLLAAGALVLLALLVMASWRYLAREARRRQEEAQRRETARVMLEVSRALNSTLNLQDVLRGIMGELANIVSYDSAAVLLLDRSKLVVAAHRGADVEAHAPGEFDLDEAHAANQVIQTGRPFVIHDTRGDARWTASARGGEILSWMGVPLRERDKTVGVLNINSYRANRFSEEELALAEAFADQASVALQNARLHESEVHRINQELSIARDIQLSLLPTATPQIAQLEIYAYTMPAQHVSGDYLQYLPMSNGQLGIAVGDVSGKGIPAAMLMAVITTAMRDEAARNSRPADLLNALNQRLLERMQASRISSALMVGIFDPATRDIELANGGMVQPYMRNGHGWSSVPVVGYPLGLSQRAPYSSQTVTLAPESLLLMMSDGVVEAQNVAGEFYGFERLEAFLNALPTGLTAQQVAERLLEDVGSHLNGEDAQDDLTIVVVRSLDRDTPAYEQAPKTRDLTSSAEKASASHATD